MMVVDIIVATIVAIVISFLTISNIRMRLKNKSLATLATQAELDRVTVYEQAQQIFAQEHAKGSSSDGFIKFMSTSRDWAFEYIENVQRDLYELKTYHEFHGAAPKTVAQANELNRIILKLIDNLPKDEKK